MHVERIQFDEVFDVAACRDDFSFRSAGRVWYGIHFPGKPLPRDGSVYAIAFAERGNWGSVLGWRDLAQPSVTLANSTGSFLLAQSFGMILYAPFCIVGGLVFGGPEVAGAIAAVIGGIALWRTIRVVRRNRAVERALLAVEKDHPRLHSAG